MSDDPWSLLKGFEPLSLCDWPGRASSVLFLAGCNLACPTCHNFELAENDPALPVLSGRKIMGILRRRRPWLDGVVVTGGEPTMAPGLPHILAELAELGLPIKIDSNGLRPGVIEELLHSGLPLTFAIDVKGPFGKYPALSGGKTTAEQAETCLGRILGLARSHPQAFYFRQTRVPLLTDEDVAISQGYLPAGMTLIQQTYVEPRRKHAPLHTETRRTPGDLVRGANRGSDSQGPESQRHSGPHLGQAVGA